MKKFFSFIAAVLFAGSMFAQSDTLTCAQARAWALADSTNEVTIKGYVTEYIEEWSSYKNISFWMSDSANGGQVFEAYRVKCETAAESPKPGDLVCVTGTLKKYVKNTDTVPEIAAGGTFEILESGTVPPSILPDTLTCAQAVIAATTVSTEVIIKGYVTEYVDNWSSKFKNISFWMADTVDGGHVFEAWRVDCQTAEEAPAIGDLVWVKGTLKIYGTTVETDQGGTFGIIEKAPAPKNLGEMTIGEFLALKNMKDTCVISGVVTEIRDAIYGNLYMADENDTLDIYGVLTPEGVAKKFETLDVEEGDTLKVKAIYREYKDVPQVKNAIFVSVNKAPVVPGDTIELTFNSDVDDVQFTDYTETDGWWQVIAQNESYYLTLSNDGIVDVPEGTYDVADLDEQYSFIEVLSKEKEYAFKSGSVTIAVSDEGVVTVTGELVAKDRNTYIINITYKDPEAKDTVNLVMTGELQEYLETEGAFYVEGYTEDESMGVALFIYNDYVVGEYTEYDLNPNYSAVMVGEDDVDIFSANISVEENANAMYTVHADLLCYNNVRYIVTMVIYPEALENTKVNGKATKTIKNGQLIIEKANVQYNAQGAVIK